MDGTVFFGWSPDKVKNWQLHPQCHITVHLLSSNQHANCELIQKYPKHRLHATLVAICKLRNVRHKLIHLLRNFITIKRAVIKRTPFPRPSVLHPSFTFTAVAMLGPTTKRLRQSSLNQRTKLRLKEPGYPPPHSTHDQLSPTTTPPPNSSSASPGSGGAWLSRDVSITINLRIWGDSLFQDCPSRRVCH